MPTATDGCRRAAALLMCAALVCACGKKPAAPFPEWADVGAERRAAEGAKLYLECALRAEALTRRYASRVSFTPAQRQTVLAAVSPLLDRIASTRPRDFRLPFEAGSPFEAKRGHRGYWLLGEAFAWRIEAKVRNGTPDGAVGDALAGTRFGFDLCGGGALEASLGFAVVDRVREAILPALRQLSPASLRQLSSGLGKALEDAPPFAKTIANERLSMLRAVQEVQDAYREGTLERLRSSLGPSVSDAIRYLRELPAKDADARPEYFAGFAEEAESLSRHYDALARLNARQRAMTKGPVLAEERPWRRLAKHFFTALEPVFGTRDETMARTRLLALHAHVLAQVAANGRAPRDLSAVAPQLRIDPYTGQQLVYRADGREFRLYSVGADFRDDGGQTNDTFSSPDLTLEAPSA